MEENTFACICSYLIGAHISRGVFLYWWGSLLLMALLAFLHRYLYLPTKRKLYEIVKVVNETDEVTSLYIKPIYGQKMNHLPGQFAYTRFESRSISPEEHHFTISSAPQDKYLQFTIKSLGDFTANIKKIAVGDRVKLEGPYGAFTNVDLRGPFLFIAGGIGITPIRSMIRNMSELNDNKKTFLLYSANSKADLIYYDEFTKLNKEKWFDAKLLERRITETDLSKALASLKETPQIFLVGPEPMMESVEKMLVDSNIPKEKIYTEKFSLK